MRCNTCGEYIYKGKKVRFCLESIRSTRADCGWCKFNARKETAEGETYFGIKIFRFYSKPLPPSPVKVELRCCV